MAGQDNHYGNDDFDGKFKANPSQNQFRVFDDKKRQEVGNHVVGSRMSQACWPNAVSPVTEPAEDDGQKNLFYRIFDQGNGERN